jgi:tetratricopeptide (TPR) repeat protein
MKKLLTLSLLALLGCATSSVETKSTSLALDEQLKQKAKSMNVTVHGVLETELKASQCQPAISKLKGKWNWVDAVNAGNICFKAHDLDAVEKLAADLATHDTSTPWGPYFFARVALDKGQLDRALWMVELSLRRAPDFGVTHYLKGQILWARKEYKEASTSFEKSVTYDNGIGPAHLILAQLYLRDQDYNKAAPQFESALKLLPDNMVALSGVAETQLHLNSPTLALDAFVRLSELDSSDGQYLSHIGALYEGALNNPERALNAYQKLHDMIKAGKVRKNIDPDNDSKIKELQAALNKARSIASENQKSASAKGDGK